MPATYMHAIIEELSETVVMERSGKHVSATMPNNGSIVERQCFLLGPPQGYIMWNPGRLKGLID
jgi:hypothetical protein